MKKLLLLFSFFITALISIAQKQTFDIISYAAPATWKKSTTTNIISYAITNAKTNSWCQIALVKSTISKGSIDEDFKSEWEELVVKNYNPTDQPKLDEVKETDGWKIKSGAVKFTFNNSDATAMLTTMSGFERCVSIVITTNTQDYFKDVASLLSSIDLKKPETSSSQITVSNENKNSIFGTWGATASDNSNYRMKNGIMNYISRQYTFNEDGSYSFVSKAYDPLMDKILLGKENGNYQIISNNITIIPKKSVLEAWSKKNGADDWDKLLSTQNIALEKVTYQFTKHFFSGTQIWNLVLQSDKATLRDGANSSNTSFKNAWYYGPLSANNLQIKLPGNVTAIKKEEVQKQPPAVTNGFAFTTTNFDDGWTSTVKEDWVEVTKENIKVLLHYPKEGTVFPADPEPLINAAWNILVAPRYKNLKNYKTAFITTYNRPYLGMGYATENATEKNVFIVLYRQGQNWIEFIAPDKNTLIQQYKFDPETIQWSSEPDLMIPLANMTGYNKFSIAAPDFKGKWTSDFTGIQQLYYVYTGQYAGMNMNQSNEEFIFNDGNTYNWKLLVVNGMVGNVKYNAVKSSGKFSVANNWQVKFSMIENRARTYHAFWSCIKGARILNLLDADYPGSGIYQKYGLAK